MLFILIDDPVEDGTSEKDNSDDDEEVDEEEHKVVSDQLWSFLVII